MIWREEGQKYLYQAKRVPVLLSTCCLFEDELIVHFTEFCRFLGRLRKSDWKIHRYFLRQKCRPKNVVFSDISLMAILAGVNPSESVKVRHSPLASENLTNNQP